MTMLATADQAAPPEIPIQSTQMDARVKALELQVRELSHVVLSVCGDGRAWQIATLALLRGAGSSPEACKYLSQTLEETRRGMVKDGVAQAYAEGYCMTARVILETAYGADQRPSGSSGAH